MKKINCKNNLFKRQELEARKIRKVLIGAEEDVGNKIENRIKDLYDSFKLGCKNIGEQKKIYFFYEFVMRWDIVIYSAFQRIGGFAAFSKYVINIGLI